MATDLWDTQSDLLFDVDRGADRSLGCDFRQRVHEQCVAIAIQTLNRVDGECAERCPRIHRCDGLSSTASRLPGLVLALGSTDAVLFRFGGTSLDDVACFESNSFAQVSIAVDVLDSSDCDRGILVDLPVS